MEANTGPKASQKHVRTRDWFWMIFGAKKEAKMEPKWSPNGPNTNLETGPKTEGLGSSKRRSAEVQESRVGGRGGAGHSEAEERSLRREFRIRDFRRHVPRGYGG